MSYTRKSCVTMLVVNTTSFVGCLAIVLLGSAGVLAHPTPAWVSWLGLVSAGLALAATGLLVLVDERRSRASAAARYARTVTAVIPNPGDPADARGDETMSLIVGSKPELRLFPIQDGPDIPWRVMALHEAAALKQHDHQSLEKLAERRGLSVDEAISVIAGGGDYMRYWRTPGRDRHDLKGNTQALLNLVYVELVAMERHHDAKIADALNVASAAMGQALALLAED